MTIRQPQCRHPQLGQTRSFASVFVLASVITTCFFAVLTVLRGLPTGDSPARYRTIPIPESPRRRRPPQRNRASGCPTVPAASSIRRLCVHGLRSSRSRRVKKNRRTQIALKTLDLRLTRVSHLRRLISPVCRGNWPFSAPNMLFLRLVGYCLLDNHFHLLLWPHEDGDLSRWMQ